MEKITLKDKTFVKYILENDIYGAVEQIANQINEDYKNDTPGKIVTLNGAMIYAVGLIKK